MKKTGNSYILPLRRSHGWGLIISTITAVFCLFTGFQSLAQSPDFNAAVSSNSMSLGERFQLQFTLNSQGSEFNPPDLSDFRILSGPNQSNSMQFVNGRMSASLSFNYILQANKAGKFTINAADIKANGKVLKTQPIEITVDDNGSSTPPNQGRKNNNQSSKKKDNIFIDVSVSKSNPYVGEAISLDLKLYTNEQVINGNASKLPSLNGFWSENIEVKQKQKFEFLNGVRYQVLDLRQYVLFPQRAGKLTIEPFEFEMIVRKQTQSRSRSIFDQFFGSYEDVKVALESDPVSINVKALPSGQPNSFKGAVGNYNFEVAASKDDVETNEGIDIKININGKGNLKLFDAPDIKLPTDFEVYDPEIQDNIAIQTNGLSGSRLYNNLIIPRHKGSYSIEPVEFSFFNPSTEKYVTLKSEPININVRKGDTEGQNINYTNINKEDVAIIGNDIRYIKTKTSLTKANSSFYGSVFFYVLLILPFLLLIVVWFVRNYFRELYGDQLRLKRVKASGLAKKRLSSAKKCLDKNDMQGFYEELSKALYGYVSDRLNIGFSKLNKDNIKSHLQKSKVPDSIINDLLETLETCEMARFAPNKEGAGAGTYDKASELIRNIENNLKS